MVFGREKTNDKISSFKDTANPLSHHKIASLYKPISKQQLAPNVKNKRKCSILIKCLYHDESIILKILLNEKQTVELRSFLSILTLKYLNVLRFSAYLKLHWYVQSGLGIILDNISSCIIWV